MNPSNFHVPAAAYTSAQGNQIHTSLLLSTAHPRLEKNGRMPMGGTFHI